MAPRSASHLALCVLFFLHLSFSIPKSIQEAAQARSISPEQFLEDVKGNALAYQRSNKIAGRVAFMNSLKQAMEEPGLHLVIGGQSLGKSKIVETLVAQEGDDFRVLKVDMRLPPGSSNVLECLQEQARRTWNQKNVPLWLQVGVDVLQAAVKAVGLATAKTDGVTGGAEVAIATLLGVPKPEDFLAAWVAAVGALDRLPVIVIDEANMAFPSGNGNGNVKKEVAREALQALVALAKQNRKVSVILIASDYAFPLGLEELGFNKFDCVRSMVCPEVEEEAMLKVLAEWGLSEDLAKEFYESFGGNVFLCDQAIDKLRWQFSMGEEELFDPVSVQGNDGLGDLVGGSLTRQHMVNLADKRWSPIQDGSPEEETESQAAARIIAKKNFGAIINKKTTTFLEPALKEEMFRDPYVQRVLIPPTTYARKSIQSMVKTMKPRQGRPSQAGAVWVRQLQQDDGTFDEIGAAFQVKGDLKNVDDLKKGIKKEKPNRVSCDADEIFVYSKSEDAEWVEDKKMSASLRETDETDCYGFTLPSA